MRNNLSYDSQSCLGNLKAIQEMHFGFQVCQPPLKQGAMFNLWGSSQVKMSGNFCFIWREINWKILTVLNLTVTQIWITDSTSLWRSNWSDHCSCLIDRTASLVEHSRCKTTVQPKFDLTAWRQTGDLFCLTKCLQQSFFSKWKLQSPKKESGAGELCHFLLDFRCTHFKCMLWWNSNCISSPQSLSYGVLWAGVDSV